VTAAAVCADSCCAAEALAPDRRAVLVRRVRLLVAATITYNVVEAVIALSAGTAASSGALIGFGLDSVIEVASAVAVAWQFSGENPEVRERRALKMIALSIYVTVEAVGMFFAAAAPESPVTGVVLAGCCSMRDSAGGGPTRSSHSRSPVWRSEKAERPGAASIAADARQAGGGGHGISTSARGHRSCGRCRRGWPAPRRPRPARCRWCTAPEYRQ
jgi:hypothetical protein